MLIVASKGPKATYLYDILAVPLYGSMVQVDYSMLCDCSVKISKIIHREDSVDEYCRICFACTVSHRTVRKYGTDRIFIPGYRVNLLGMH